MCSIPELKPLELYIGTNEAQNAVVYPLDQLPHLLVCGMNGCGRSGFLRAQAALLAHGTPAEQLRLVLMDETGVEFVQFRELPQDKQINIVNNNNSSASAAASASVGVRTAVRGKYCNKWTAFFLCLFLGYFGAHKFYEGRVGMGILYLLTIGLFGIGWIVDIILILMKPNPYFVEK